MTTLIIILAATAHVMLALAIARMTFSRVRARILKSDGFYHEWSEGARIQGAGIILTVICLAGLWPLLLATALVMAAPPKTPDEIAAEMKRQAKRVAELERELGLKP